MTQIGTNLSAQRPKAVQLNLNSMCAFLPNLKNIHNNPTEYSLCS